MITMLQIGYIRYSNNLLLQITLIVYLGACLSKSDKEINQQTNYVGGPDNNTNGSLLIISDP